MNRQLFSIDVDAHLRKAASHTFSSPGHYPVELVRASLRRGANRVEIDMDGACIRVKDNGQGMNETDLTMLRCLLEANRGPGEKETAVEWLQTREGTGMLAIFAPRPERFLVENASANGKFSIEFKNNRAAETHGVSSLTHSTGTAVTLFCKDRDVEKEKEMLTAFCRSVPKTLLLNGKPFGGGKPLHGQMGTVNKTVRVPGETVQCTIGIPRAGNLCHIRFLDQFIPWHHITLPPRDGFVFDAALEYTGTLTDGFTRFLCENARKLYHWLTQRYASTQPEVKRRIEELLFTHARVTEDYSLVDEFEPFLIYNVKGQGGELSLREVRQAANVGALFAVPRGKENFSYNTANKLVLSLPREQADFLINTMKLPIVFLTPSKQETRQWKEFLWKWRNRFRRLALKLSHTPKQIPDIPDLTEEENKFIVALNSYLSNRGSERAVLVPSSGPFPCFRLQLDADSLQGKSLLAVRRNHRLVRRAVHAVQQDPRNIEMVIPLLRL